MLSVPGLCSFQNLDFVGEKELRFSVVSSALKVACTGSFSIQQSIPLWHFARQVGRGIDVDALAIQSMMGWNATELFQKCVDAGLNLQSIDDDGKKILHHAISTGFCLRFPLSAILNDGVNVSAVDHEGVFPLQIAVERRMPEIVTILLEAGADPMSVDKQGMSVLLQAVYSGHLSNVTQVLKSVECFTKKMGLQIVEKVNCFTYGNRAGKRPDNGFSALHVAVMKPHADILNAILQYGASVDAQDSLGATALHYASRKENLADIIAFSTSLFKAGAKSSYLDKSVETPLHLAASRWRNDELACVLKCFISCGNCKIDARNSRGQTILYQAIKSAADTAVTTLLGFNASAQIHDAQGLTPLHYCAEIIAGENRQIARSRGRKLKAIVQSLMNAGANPGVKDFQGLSAIETAAIKGNECCVRELAVQMLGNSDMHCDGPNESPPKVLLTSAWKLAVINEQWPVVRSLYILQELFDKDMSLLRWARGLRFIRYLADSGSLVSLCILRRNFTTSSLLARGKDCESEENAGKFHSFYNVKGLKKFWTISNRPKTKVKIEGNIPRWKDLPELMRDYGGPWLPDARKHWEDLAESHLIHADNDEYVILELLGFVREWDFPIFVKYFGDLSATLGPMVIGVRFEVWFEYNRKLYLKPFPGRG